VTKAVSFYADLHIHSKHSRATSRTCDLEHLYLWGRKKGITVVATGDFTHPGWLTELRAKLLPAEPGLYRLRPDAERAASAEVPHSCQGATRFMLSVEIATIYKKGPKTRKVHHVICAPDFDHVDRLVTSLSRIGNLTADGRPILGLDSRDLLEIVLESGSGAYLIPAHIWTPWFSALGSKSGFDTIEECYGDLAENIFAVETGLSSDPAMNWRLSSLDRYRLVSNSDAHSPPKMGRNACVFDCRPDYFAMRHALATGEGYAGTVEFYPEKGKYHLDGHRKCGACLSPAETRRLAGLCPVCGKSVTVGVMHRVEELADRPDGTPRPDADPYRSLIPLPEILSELEGVGPGSKRVARTHEALLTRLGPELHILEHAPLETIGDCASGQLVEAVRRMRNGNVIREAGFDGEFGNIRLFTPEELAEQSATALLFPEEERPSQAAQVDAAAEDPTPFNPPPQPLAPASTASQVSSQAHTCASLLDGLDPAQRAAAECIEGPLIIIAGPGTGKTRTITHRLAHIVRDHGADPESCLAITFTRRAAGEMRERLDALLPNRAARIPVRTFHGLGLDLLREQADRTELPSAFGVAADEERQAILAQAMGLSKRRAARLVERIATCKRQGAEPEADLAQAFTLYEAALRERALVDFEDLLRLPVQLLEADSDLADTYRARFHWLCVDEYQDIDALQYRLVRSLAQSDGNVCVIGDPDQAVYGFRGADVQLFHRFREDYPEAKVVRLGRSYRCTRTVLDASFQVILSDDDHPREPLETLLDSPERVLIHEAPTDRAEAEFVVHTMEQFLGGHNLFSLDSGRSEGQTDASLAFSDFAVLYRTDAQAGVLCEALARSGIPYQKRSHHRLADQPLTREVASLLRAEESPQPVRERMHRAGRQLLDNAEGAIARLGPEWIWPDPDAHSDDARTAAFKTQVEVAVALLEPLAIQCGHDLHRFLDELALGAEADCWDPRAERVSLLTLHAAKGLEFDVVFITGCEDGLLPMSWGGRLEPAAREEERRLFYVGMTRARQRLVLSHARRRHWHGKVRDAAPSPFLKRIADGLLERRETTARKRARTRLLDQMDLF
jgi:ATP-dependent DNA helicase UvrD/PcrA